MKGARGASHQVVVARLENIRSPQRKNRRDVDVYLPPSYARGRRRYPVIYMHDGQNLSDPEKAFAGTWELPSALVALAERGVEAIVVGVPNMGRERFLEYSPFADRRHGGGEADAYLDFLVSTVKPIVDRRFRTRATRAATGLLGSSMGGLVSLYAFFRRSDVFGFAGAMSPALWFAGRAIFRLLEQVDARPGRIYLDVGTDEGAAPLRDAREMAALLGRKGYAQRSLRYIEATGAHHNEAYWRDRLEPALAFLLGRL